MRIKEEFKKSGYFWLPSAPNKKFPGTLSISDGGVIDLEVVELFEPVDWDSSDWESIRNRLNWEPAFSNHFKRIVGHIETDEITLDGCRINKGLSYYKTGLSKSVLRVSRAFTGVKYNEDEIPRFKILIFSIDGINNWIGRSATDIEKLIQGENISFQHPEEISFNLANGMELSITFKQGRSESLSPREQRITQRTYFKLVSQDARELDDFTSVAEKIINFLCFAMGDVVCFDSMEVASENPPPLPPSEENSGYDKIGLLPINIFYSSQFYSKDKPSDFNWLFKFGQIQNDAGRIICNWINAYEELDPTFNLYFLATMRTQPSFEAKFLTLVTGLEIYHRRTSDEKQMDEAEFDELVEILIENCSPEKRIWLEGRLKFANEIVLRKRIKRLIEPFKNLFGNKENRKKLINRIVDTRNYLTHYDLSLKSKAAKGWDLQVLCQKVEVLFQLHFLQLMGFSEKDINSIADRQLWTKLQF
ncbi:hypothetical protein C6503_12370 [Candidatus Poribacteria bacterium]|nr:MAG: hypothetical protein C6503_12370 [Candidatus Poribacteria bacterium]